VSTIYHIAFCSDWEQAKTLGSYTVSTRGRSLDDVGYIHAAASTRQAESVANLFYADASDLVLLVIDTTKLSAPIRHDRVDGWDEPFPHILGPLNPDAVTDAVPIAPGAEGRFSITAP